MIKSTVLFLLLLVALTDCTAPAPSAQTESVVSNQKRIFKKDYPFPDWPFAVDEGILKCESPCCVVFIANGKAYAINGTAKNWAKERGYIDVDETEMRMEGSVGKIIQDGLKLNTSNIGC